MSYLNENTFYANAETKATRDGLGDGLLEMGHENENLVVLTGDLKDSTKATKFAEAFPKRFFEVGVAEQNMAGIAAGLALAGKTPVVTSYSIFIPGRNWEQLRLSVAFSNTNVKLASTHSGLSATQDGATHQALEDIALTRVLPNMTVLSPADYTQARKAIQLAIKTQGPFYIRLAKNSTPLMTSDEAPFVIGGSHLLNVGNDITIVATGPILHEALKAARILETKHHITADVINAYSLKPFDSKTLIDSAKKTKNVFTIEEHQISGGLGSIVAEILSEQCPVKVKRIGMNDTFGESGKYEELLRKFKLDADSIVAAVAIRK